jgi:hypothetical protein
MFKNILILTIKFLIEIIEKWEYRNKELDENNIDKKILNTIETFNIKVKTDSGFQPISHIHITQPYSHYKLKTDSFQLDCADNHIVFLEDYSQVFVKDLKSEDKIWTENGLEKVNSINKIGFVSSMFDVTVDHPDHRFYTNGILSHNTINAAITILHYLTFNNDKNAMIVANIAATTIEIVDKIKSIYSLLPFFLKVGIKNWNQRSIIFENGCRIKTAARSKTPAIGFTIDLLYMDEFAHIPSNIIEPYYTAAFPTVSAIQNSKIIITSTPNGMNLFYKLLSDAERPDGDPLKNNYKSLRVYWYQVPGRFVTYYRLNPFKLKQFEIDKDYIYDQVISEFGDKTKVDVKFIGDLQKDVIYIYNNEEVSDKMAKEFQFIDNSGKLVSIFEIAEVTTWKEEAIKDIGGEDAFNQEYGLRFVNATRSLLSEAIIEGLLQNKRNFKWEEIWEMDNKLKFSYKDLKWIDDPEVFSPIMRKKVKGVISIDISEGLGQDYSIINIFKIAPKPKEIIESQLKTITHMSDFFQLVQIGIFRSNVISVKQLAELFYILGFEFFEPDNFKVVLEINTYGNEFLAHLPHVFDGNNNYGSSIFLRYKHRADATEEKIGIKIGDNKNLLVKEYQESMDKRNYLITNEDNIREITTFVKHITSAGNIRYAADIGNDDTVMTVVNSSSVFQKHAFKEMVDDYAKEIVDSTTLAWYNEILKKVDFKESADYSSIININRQRRIMKNYNSLSNNSKNWFGGNS